MPRKDPLKEVFSRMFHAPGEDPSEYKVWVVDRGGPSGLREIRGDEVERVEKGFLVLWEGTRIPLHRIVRVERSGEVIWERRGRACR